MAKGKIILKKRQYCCCFFLIVVLFFIVSQAWAENISVKDKGYIVQDSKDIHYDENLWKNEKENLVSSSRTLCNRAVFCSLMSYLGIDCTPVEMSSMGVSVVPATYYRYLIRAINKNKDCAIVRVHSDGDSFTQDHLMSCFRQYKKDTSYSPVYIWGNYGENSNPHTMLLLHAEETEFSYRKLLWLFDPSSRACDVDHIVFMNIDYKGRCRKSNVDFYRQNSFQIKWVLQFRRLDTEVLPFEDKQEFKVVQETNIRSEPFSKAEKKGTLNENRTVYVTDYIKDDEGIIWYQLDNGFWVVSEYLEEKR